MAEPVLLAILFADKVITEDNGKKGIIGTFTRFNAPSFPAVFQPWAIYVAFTNIHGPHKFSFELIKTDDNTVIFPVQGDFNVASKEETVELGINIAGVTFPAEGKYYLVFKINGETVGARFLQVSKVEPPAVKK